jgi:hypothetical protein
MSYLPDLTPLQQRVATLEAALARVERAALHGQETHRSAAKAALARLDSILPTLEAMANSAQD